MARRQWATTARRGIGAGRGMPCGPNWGLIRGAQPTAFGRGQSRAADHEPCEFGPYATPGGSPAPRASRVAANGSGAIASASGVATDRPGARIDAPEVAPSHAGAGTRRLQVGASGLGVPMGGSGVAVRRSAATMNVPGVTACGPGVTQRVSGAATFGCGTATGCPRAGSGGPGAAAGHPGPAASCPGVVLWRSDVRLTCPDMGTVGLPAGTQDFGVTIWTFVVRSWCSGTRLRPGGERIAGPTFVQRADESTKATVKGCTSKEREQRQECGR